MHIKCIRNGMIDDADEARVALKSERQQQIKFRRQSLVWPVWTSKCFTSLRFGDTIGDLKRMEM